MKKLHLILLSVFISLNAFGQRKLVLKQKLHRVVVKPGEKIGYTLKGQPNIFEGWKTLCRPCDTAVRNNLWTIDRIKDDCLVLKRFKSYETDTLTWQQYLHDTSLIDSANCFRKGSQKTCICKRPQYFWHSISYDSLASLTFSKFKNESEACGDSPILFSTIAVVFGVDRVIHQFTEEHSNVKKLLGAMAFITWGIIYADYRCRIYENNVNTYTLSDWKMKIR